MAKRQQAFKILLMIFLLNLVHSALSHSTTDNARDIGFFKLGSYRE